MTQLKFAVIIIIIYQQPMGIDTQLRTKLCKCFQWSSWINQYSCCLLCFGRILISLLLVSVQGGEDLDQLIKIIDLNHYLNQQ